MILYELINPSDCITFYAPDNEVAHVCAKLLSNMFFVKSLDKAHEYNDPDWFSELKGGELNAKFEDILINRKVEISESLHSFQCISEENRKEYDNKLSSFSDIESYKKETLSKNQTSISNIVDSAWEYANIINKL